MTGWREAPVLLPLAGVVFTVVADARAEVPLALGLYVPGGCRVEVRGSGDPVVDRRAWRRLAAVAELLAAGP